MNAIGRFILLATLVAPVACDSTTDAEPKAAAAESPDETKAPQAAPAQAPEGPEEKAPAVQVSATMTTFMSELGEHDKVTAALSKHGAESLEADMGMYNIEEPAVTAAGPGRSEGETCYAMKAKTGVVQRKFEICWKDGKITRAENKGLHTR